MKNMKKILSLALVGAMVVSLAACEKKANNEVKTTPTAAPTKAVQSETEKAPAYVWDGAYVEEDDYKAYITYDLEAISETIEPQLTSAQKTAVSAAVEKGKAAIASAQSVTAVQKAYQNAYTDILSKIELANGVESFVKLSRAEKTDILGMLEKYGVTTGITGVTLFENGSYVMYNPRITLGTENYIVGYGFGALKEGDITADLEYETNPAWKRYYHTSETNDPGTLNYLNDQGAQVGDLYEYLAASYFTTFMKSTKDGYDWTPELAMEKPVPVNDTDGDGAATKWRFQIRTEKEGLKYTTGSKIPSRAAFNNRGVKLEDYLTPYKLLLTQANNLYRGSEAANSTSGAIKGAKDYYNASKDGFNEDAWKKVGVRVYEENGKSYLEIEFTTEYDRFYAMYYSNGLYMPVPQDFIDLVTVQNYLGFNKTATETPVDNSLSLGAFYPEAYNSDQEIVFKKNPNYVFADSKYKVQGVHVKIFPAAETDASATINEFLAGHFDACSIPMDYLDQYRTDPRTRSTTGDSCFKLNMNATDQATWEALFGVNGTVTQTEKDAYWNLKPVMSNAHFRKGLSYALDRLSFASARGSVPSVDYLSSNYMSDPEDGVSYSTTEAHKNAIKALVEETDGYGYSLELAREYFRLALTELEAEKKITPGTPENPTVLDIEVGWQRPAQEDQYHKEVKKYFEDAFNDPSVSGGKYKLSLNFWVGNVWSDVYYNKMMVGQFDIGFGSISGNSLDPLGFMNVLSSDQEISHSFTLNWGTDTNDPLSYPLVYDGKLYSFDALFNAANTSAVVVDGKNKAALDMVYTQLKKNDDGTYTARLTVSEAIPDQTEIKINKVVCCNYERYNNGDGQYAEEEVPFTVSEMNGVTTVTVTVPAALAADYATGSGTTTKNERTTGFDFYYDITLGGNTTKDIYYSTNDVFPE
jgi:hypothetical protein